jgi:hypothetical protein
MSDHQPYDKQPKDNGEEFSVKHGVKLGPGGGPSTQSGTGEDLVYPVIVNLASLIFSNFQNTDANAH